MFSGMSSQCIDIKDLLITINLHLHEQQAYKFVKFSDINEEWSYCPPDVVNFPVPHPSIQKL